MRLTTKGRFAVTAMIDLAMHDEQGVVTLTDISQRQRISRSYLEQLFAKLRRHQIVNSVRGPGGGYRLARSAELITVAEIIQAVDEMLDATRCGGKGNCDGAGHHDGHCMTHQLWSKLTQKMFEFLASISIKELAQQQRLREQLHAAVQNQHHGVFAPQAEVVGALPSEASETNLMHSSHLTTLRASGVK